MSIAAKLCRLCIPARPVHLAVFGMAAIAAHLLGGVPADTAMYAGLLPVIALLMATIAIDFLRPSSSYTRHCR